MSEFEMEVFKKAAPDGGGKPFISYKFHKEMSMDTKLWEITEWLHQIQGNIILSFPEGKYELKLVKVDDGVPVHQS
jgi:hypothetical protein